MDMAYPTNPHIPRLRMEAVKLIRAGWSYRKVARYTGFSIGSLSTWVRKAHALGRHWLWIPTESSRPKHRPSALPPQVVAAIIAERQEHGRCAEVVHQALLRKKVTVSLSSVKRTLKRQHLLKERSPWKRPHDPTLRPAVVKPGDLVEIDTIHIGFSPRFFVYTLLDVYTRWAYAQVAEHKYVQNSLGFVLRAQDQAPFPFQFLQSDHGSEFSQAFTLGVGVPHRHTRVRCPDDNAHLERFNRTVQEECLHRVPTTVWHYRRALPSYLRYYNHERLHMGLNYQTPLEAFRRS